MHPVTQLLVEVPPGEPFAQPGGVIPVRDGWLRQSWSASAAVRAPKRRQLVQQERVGPAVRDEVVDGEKQYCRVLTSLDESHPKRQGFTEAKRPVQDNPRLPKTSSKRVPEIIDPAALEFPLQGFHKD